MRFSCLRRHATMPPATISCAHLAVSVSVSVAATATATATAITTTATAIARHTLPGTGITVQIHAMTSTRGRRRRPLVKRSLRCVAALSTRPFDARTLVLLGPSTRGLKVLYPCPTMLMPMLLLLLLRAGEGKIPTATHSAHAMPSRAPAALASLSQHDQGFFDAADLSISCSTSTHGPACSGARQPQPTRRKKGDKGKEKMFAGRHSHSKHGGCRGFGWPWAPVRVQMDENKHKRTAGAPTRRRHHIASCCIANRFAAIHVGRRRLFSCLVMALRRPGAALVVQLHSMAS